MGFLKDLMTGHEKYFEENAAPQKKINDYQKPVLAVVEEKKEEVKAA